MNIAYQYFTNKLDFSRNLTSLESSQISQWKNWTESYWGVKSSSLLCFFALFSHLSNNSRTGIECWWWSSSSLVFSKGAKDEQLSAQPESLSATLLHTILHIFNVDSLHCRGLEAMQNQESRRENTITRCARQLFRLFHHNPPRVLFSPQ